MSIFDRFRRKEQRSFFPESASGVRTPLLFSAEQNPTVSACIDKISKTLASLPIRVWERTSDGNLKLAQSNSLYQTLLNPAVDETPILFYSTMIRFYYNKGNAFLFKVHSDSGRLLGFSNIDPNKVEVTRDTGNFKKRYRIDGKYYTDREILHIPYAGPGYNGTVGFSPISYYRELINLDNKLLNYIENYFDNSVGSRIVLKLGSTYPSRKASMDQLYSEIVPVFNKFVVGAANAGKPMIGLPDADIAKIDQPSNVQSQLKSLMDMVERQIAQTVFSMPYELINSEASKYDSLETKQNDFLASCIEPLGTHFCQSFAMELTPAEQVRYQINYEYKNLLTTNTTQTVDYLTKEFLSGALSMNEVRKKLGMESMGEAGDYHFVPANLMPLTMDNINAYMAKSKEIQAHNPTGDDKV